MARPRVEDKLKQIPVPVKQSVIDRVGKQEIINNLKSFIKQHYAPQSEHLPG